MGIKKDIQTVDTAIHVNITSERNLLVENFINKHTIADPHMSNLIK